MSKKGSGKSTLKKDTLEEKSSKCISVQTETFDNFLKEKTSPTIIKLDVEGSEVEFLKGADNFLKSYKGKLFMEVWGGPKGKLHSYDAVKLLYDFNFKSYKILNDGRTKKITIDFEIMDEETHNYLFMK